MTLTQAEYFLGDTCRDSHAFKGHIAFLLRFSPVGVFPHCAFSSAGSCSLFLSPHRNSLHALIPIHCRFQTLQVLVPIPLTLCYVCSSGGPQVAGLTRVSRDMLLEGGHPTLLSAPA